MANTFPRIYSLCTVGVRQHYNSEYLFHPVRTDFTGGNGLGKSIIADLMQLIVIPRRDMWKPGTEGIGKDERRVEGIPLNKEYIQYAYAFLNIERRQGQFIVIGVYISKTPRIPVRPFIIQGGNDFTGGNLIPFNRPLHPEDFLAENKMIYDLREVVKCFKEKHGLLMKDFFQLEGIIQYYDILYKNNILPVNLAKPDNLKTYAKVIQSFARAKSLDITNSKSLQNFLFEDNEEIKRTFEEQKEQLHSLLKQYRDNYFHTHELQAKQKKLLSLLDTYQKSNKAKEDFLKSSTAYAYKRYEESKQRYENNKKQIEASTKNLLKQKNDFEKTTEELYSHYTNLQEVCRLLREKFEIMLKGLSDDAIQKKQQEANVLRDKINLISGLSPIIERYGTIEKIEAKLAEQNLYREKKNKLNKILSLYSFSDFEKSLWTKTEYQNASKYYNEKLNELPTQIEELETLIELFEGTRDNSFFHWAIQTNQPLTREQETVLMYLKELSVEKPETFEEGTCYIANPSVLLSSFEKEKNGIWVTLGELREFVPLITKQRFTNTKNLKTVLEKDTKTIKEELTKARYELNTIIRLSEELNAIGFNQELAEIYKNKDEIENYIIDNSLNEEKILLIRENWDDIQRLPELQIQFASIENEAIELAKKQSDIRNKMNGAQHAMNVCEYDFTRLRLESNMEIKIEAQNYSDKEISELEELKVTLDAKIKTATDQRTWSEKYIIAAEGELRGLRHSEPILKQQMEESLAIFNEKKQTMEAELGLIFEPGLVMGELNEQVIERLQKKSEELVEIYHEEFTRVMESFEETKGNKNPELIIDKYNFKTLVNILCGKLGLEGLGPELERLNEELKKFGDLQLTIIIDVFKKVEVQYNAFRKLITELNFFFKENRISGVYNFQVDFNDRRDISIDWIRRMREMAKHQRLSAKLFITTEEDGQVSPEKLILNIAKQITDIGNNCEISDLLDPKFYFDLRVGLYDDAGNRYPGSGGEAYTALALLCIGRMSVIQRDKNRPGIRFILIEELSNIDDTNFGLFPEIAKMFGYQLLTMTPKPFGSYTESEWFLHILIRGKDKNINYTPMSFFRTKTSKQKLEEYMKTGPIKISSPLVSHENEQQNVSSKTTEVSVIEKKSIGEDSPITEIITVHSNVQDSDITSDSKQSDKISEITGVPEISDELREKRKEKFLELREEKNEKKDNNAQKSDEST